METATDRAPLEEARELPSSGLLSFYDRLRERVAGALERRGGRLGRATSDALLLVPDVFILLVRLALDRDVPKPTRTLIAGTLAYFVLPVDLLPEAVIGVGGFVDDLVIACAVLAQSLGGELEPYAEKYWSGSRRLREVLRDVSQAGHALLGEKMYGRVQRFLARRGVSATNELPSTSAPS